jgi:hypothetical protein
VVEPAGVGDADALWAGVGLGDGVAEWDGDGEGVALPLAWGDGVAFGVAVTVVVGVTGGAPVLGEEPPPPPQAPKPTAATIKTRRPNGDVIPVSSAAGSAIPSGRLRT